MPSIPRDAIWIFGMWPIAVKHTIQIGVSAAVVPVSTWKRKPLILSHKIYYYWKCLFVWFLFYFTLAKLCAVVQTLVIIFVLRAEISIIVVAQGISGISTVVGDEELVAVHFIAQCEEAVFSVAYITLPVLRKCAEYLLMGYYSVIKIKCVDFIWFLNDCAWRVLASISILSTVGCLVIRKMCSLPSQKSPRIVPKPFLYCFQSRLKLVRPILRLWMTVQPPPLFSMSQNT